MLLILLHIKTVFMSNLTIISCIYVHVNNIYLLKDNHFFFSFITLINVFHFFFSGFENKWHKNWRKNLINKMKNNNNKSVLHSPVKAL